MPAKSVDGDRASDVLLPAIDPVFFASPGEFSAWLEAHHASAMELWVGYHERATGRPSLTWPESVDEALCFGWIDGLRRSVDAERYAIRFTPRRPESVWSRVDLDRVAALTAEGRMRPAGSVIHAARRADAAAACRADRRRAGRRAPLDAGRAAATGKGLVTACTTCPTIAPS